MNDDELDNLNERVMRALGWVELPDGLGWQNGKKVIEDADNYSENIFNAMELANEFDQWTLEKKPDPFGSTYAFHGVGFRSTYEVSPVGGFGDTAAEAICQAWLAWKEKTA